MISTVSERQIIMKCRTEKPHHNNHLESLSLKLLSLLLFLLFFLLFCCRCRRPRCCGNIICKLARTGLCTPNVAYLRDACSLWHPKTNQRHLAVCAQQRRLSNIEPPHISRDRESMQEYKKAHQLTGRVHRRTGRGAGGAAAPQFGQFVDTNSGREPTLFGQNTIHV